jgi:hypothetical protein
MIKDRYEMGKEYEIWDGKRKIRDSRYGMYSDYESFIPYF